MTVRAAVSAILAVCAAALVGGPISAQQSAQSQFYTFRSALPSAAPGWCIDVPDAKYEPGTPLQLWDCVRRSNQSFGNENQSSLTIGGLCLDSLGGNGRKPGEEGDPIGIVECDGSGRQVWELQPLPDGKTFAIASGGLCVTVDDPAGGRAAPLVLKECNQSLPQAFLTGNTAKPVYVTGGGGSFVESETTEETEYYVWRGRRYCWYGGGWHGAGWYWCGENRHRGVGWGGPVGWHFWHHHGHPVKPHPILLKKDSKKPDNKKKNDGKKPDLKKQPDLKKPDLKKKSDDKKQDLKKKDVPKKPPPTLKKPVTLKKPADTPKKPVVVPKKKKP